MTQRKKSIRGKRKRSDKKFSASLQHHQLPAKKYPSKPTVEGNVELNESTLVDERDAPTINPNKVTRL